MSDQPPVIGAALSVLDLPRFRDWLISDQRDLELQDFCFASVLNGDWRSIADIARKQLDGYRGRLGLHGPFSGFDIDASDPDIRSVVQRRMQQILDVADHLGAVQVVLHSPYRAWDHHNLDQKPHGRERKIAAVHDCLRDAVRRAEDQGVHFVLENIQDLSPADRRDLADSFDSPAMRLSVDTGHAQYCHHVGGAPAVERFVADAGAMLAHVHLQDGDGLADRHWQIGTGSIDWAPVFRAIAETGARPHLVLELNDSRTIPPSLAHLAAAGLAR